MKNQSKQIEDFGKKIGGARKDMYYRDDGLFDIDVIEDWTGIERENLLNKKNVFPKPDYQKLKDEGVDIAAIYFVKKMYDSLPAKPVRNTEERYGIIVLTFRVISDIYPNLLLLHEKFTICSCDYRQSQTRKIKV